MTGFIWGVIIFCLVVFVLFAYAVYRTDVWRVYDAEHGLYEKKKSKNVKVWKHLFFWWLAVLLWYCWPSVLIFYITVSGGYLKTNRMSILTEMQSTKNRRLVWPVRVIKGGRLFCGLFFVVKSPWKIKIIVVQRAVCRGTPGGAADKIRLIF